VIKGIGTDIIQVSRLERTITNNPRFVDKVFTPNEIAYCESRASKYQSYAARFAAKEAVMKAIGTGWDGKINWADIEVVPMNWQTELVLHNASLEYVRVHGMTDSTYLSATKRIMPLPT
jgi:holo-[acyl-carrier protein] synthase